MLLTIDNDSISIFSKKKMRFFSKYKKLSIIIEMPFTLENMKDKDTLTKIQVIIMVELEKPPLTSFKSLSLGGQRKFNEKLNAYIKKFPELDELWELQLQQDFNNACIEELYVPTFKAENQFVAILNTDVIRLRREGEEAPRRRVGRHQDEQDCRGRQLFERKGTPNLPAALNRPRSGLPEGLPDGEQTFLAHSPKGHHYE